MDTKKIGKFLRDLRREQNLTQEELGEKLGATNKTISRWETGTYMPPADILLTMSKLYGVSVNEILSGERLATADYQPKAEENIVTAINDNSVAKKRSKKVLLICLSVILFFTIASIVLIATLTLKGNYITVTFDSRGGSSIEQYTFVKGSEDGYLINEPVAPNLKGNSFVGWFYLKQIGTVQQFVETRWDFSSDRVKDSITLYAKWEVATEGLQFAENKYHSVVLFQVYYDEIDAYSVVGLNNKNATDIMIPSYYNGKPVLDISDGAFKGLPIKSVSIPDTVLVVGSNCFEQCTELTQVQMGNSIEWLGSYAFSHCKSLEFFDFPRRLKVVPSYSFLGCTNLRWANITSNIQSVERYAFSDCKNLIGVTIGRSVLYINEQAFYNCRSLVEVRNESSYLAWSNCAQFDGVLNKYKVNYGQSNLRSQDEFMFYDDGANDPLLIKYYGNEADIILPDTFYGKSYGVYDYAFYDSCVNSVTIPSGVTSIGDYAFANCNNLTSVTFDNGVTTIGKYAFSGCSQLSSAKISDSVTTIDECAFKDCVNLADINLGGGVTNIEYRAFDNCASLESIVFPESLRQIGWYAFYGSGLKYLALPSNLGYFDNRAFANCNLESISVDENNIVYRSESDCIIRSNGLYDELVLGCKNSVIPTSVYAIRESAFDQCEGLQSIFIPKNARVIYEKSFRSCNNLLSITVSEDNPKYYGSGNCIIETATKTIVVMGKNFVIPNDGSVEKISNALAYDFEDGDQVEIPNTITTIDYLAFYMGTYYGVNIVYDGTMEQWSSVKVIHSFNGTEYELPMHVKSVICADGVIYPTTIK